MQKASCHILISPYLLGMETCPLQARDYYLLHYFWIVAEERSISRASQRLHISQPPLSRQIKMLESMLGTRLFNRKRDGVDLTAAGRKLLAKIRPLVELQEQIFREIAALPCEEIAILQAGFTTAFEQSAFFPVEQRLKEEFGDDARITRASSPALYKAVKTGKLDLAIIALPVNAGEVRMQKLAFAEELLAVIPECWPESNGLKPSLKDFADRSLFWPKREQNPDWHDQMRGLFSSIGYKPELLEEPLEHDVLLARIAQGEGMALMPESFARIKREGLGFHYLSEGKLLQLESGIIWQKTNEQVEKAREIITANWR